MTRRTKLIWRDKVDQAIIKSHVALRKDFPRWFLFGLIITADLVVCSVLQVHINNVGCGPEPCHLTAQELHRLHESNGNLTMSVKWLALALTALITYFLRIVRDVLTSGAIAKSEVKQRLLFYKVNAKYTVFELLELFPLLMVVILAFASLTCFLAFLRPT